MAAASLLIRLTLIHLDVRCVLALRDGTGLTAPWRCVMETAMATESASMEPARASKGTKVQLATNASTTKTANAPTAVQTTVWGSARAPLMLRVSLWAAGAMWDALNNALTGASLDRMSCQPMLATATLLNAK